MNKPLLIGLGVAGVAVVGGIGFALMRKAPAKAGPSLPAPPPAPRLDQGMPGPQAPRPDVQASTSYKFVDRKGVPQAAADLGELRNRLLAEWGNEAAARLAPTIFPGEAEWRPAGFRVFPLANAIDASNIKSLGRMPSGYGVPAKYAVAAGLAYDAALERMNGRGGAQMVNGRG
jgi:hypothetical protein